MRAVLLASVAAVSLLNVTAAQTSATKAELPKAMLGAWCGQWGWQFPDDDAEHWWRTDNVEDCGNRGGVRVRKNGYDYYRFGPQGSCKFTSIKFHRRGQPEDHIRPNVYDPKKEEYIKAEPTKTPPSDVYLVRATCKDDNKSRYESYEIQTSDDWLVRWSSDTLSVCASPVPPSNTDGTTGLLNVREKPDAKSKIVDTVRELDVVRVDNDPLIDRFDGWKHIYHVTREGFEKGEGENHLNGWVSAKYLKPTKCPPQ
jgi:hypothetical protein